MRTVKRSALSCAAFCVAMLVAPAARAIAGSIPALAAGDEACIACHDSPIAVKVLGDGSVLPLFVESELYAASVHATIGCVGCHTDIDPAAHPSGRPIVRRESYAVERSASCRTCHPGPKTGTGTVHEVLVTRAKTLPCSACHLPHRITRLSTWRNEVSVTRYCLSCHFGEIEVAFNAEETSIPPAGEATSGQSVHLDHECTDCHAGFSKADHPVRQFSSRREHAERLAENCRACHPDQYRLAAGSVHATLAGKPGGRAPICTDCHGSHAVKLKAEFDILAGTPCRQCHAAVFEAFGGSVHGRALARPGHTTAPICSGCHTAHGVSSLGQSEQMTRVCRGCHAKIESTHARWLPEAGLHLRSVSCPACHVPAARRRVDLRFFDRSRKQEVSVEEVRRLVGPNLASRFELIESGDDAMSIWSMLRELNRVGSIEGRGFVVQVDALTGAEAHRIAGREVALKACGECHESGSKCLEKLCPVP